ncbi:DNA topoisomerase (ATP-hydrolyzing) [Mycoplasmopsis gallopavonis]|uniref:DNA topoisomerase (ATP-hydrolyzing) n=1 Tax=Mycoplasmopsis gallopavonis TaxID=76629 RepID=A0A449AYM3_9BACT|nr:DNA topoisomerase (ATP-hydrolyzing) [Mycoplasmopsis gallopavonis]RIV16524.1 DNA topoisomerase 4 subunit A [Mycoplasmopsis gallopavonis]VEU72575.1 DNA gyrase, A subunit [Mycoplasmopsis gallopavonis]
MKNQENVINKIINESLDKIISDRFSRYSKYVIQQRALPDVRDGLKPVQRRILYSMFGLGLEYDKQYKKSARVVGDVIGKYHPHGDSSVYDAMVYMAQPWKNNIPLLDMHGNIGSIDDDGPAAMRYTESKMAKVAQYLLGDIKKGTVNFVPNFDDSEIEPAVLPSLFPNILVNGAKGIASGMATDLPPHNLGEVIDATIHKIKHPNAPLDTLMKYIKGPDFPTGGIIYGTKGIVEAFQTGRSEKQKIKLYAKYKTYTKGKNQFIEIFEIPYGVVKSKLVYEIDLIINNLDIDGILEVKDQSDRNGINILITLDEQANLQSILSFLFQKTQMQITYSYNNVVIDNNAPKLLNLSELLSSYILHVKDVKTKTLEFDLNKNLLRLEIVQGFIKVSEITDEVIAVIRKAEGSKAGVIRDLISVFDFTENQARAIAELRLYRLSKTDKEAYLQELRELEDLIAKIRLLLSDQGEFNNYLINELKLIKNDLAQPRRTEIVEEELSLNYSETDLIKEEEIYIGISRLGYIKRISQRVADSNDFTNYVLKEDDYLIHYEKANTLNNFLIFTSFGNYAIIPIYKINEAKWKELGMHMTDFVDMHPNEEIVSIMEINNWETPLYIVLGTRNGMFKKVLLKDFQVTRINKVYTAINIENGDQLVNACPSDGSKNVVILTKNGLSSKYFESDLGLYGPKAKGNKGIYLSIKDSVSNFTMASNEDVITFITDDGYLKKMRVKKIPNIPKNIKGKPIFKDETNNDDFIVSDMYATREDDKLLIKNTLGETFLEPIKQYSFSAANPNLIEIKVNNLYKVRIKKHYKEQDYLNQKDLFSKEVIVEEQKVFQESQKDIEEISLNFDLIDQKLAAFRESQKKKK